MDFEWDMFTAALTSSAFLQGAMLSVALAVCAMVLASIVGFGVALLRIASNRIANAVGGPTSGSSGPFRHCSSCC